MMVIYIISIILCFLFPLTLKKIDEKIIYDEEIHNTKRIYESHRIKIPIWSWLVCTACFTIPTVNTILVIGLFIFGLLVRFGERDQGIIIYGMTANGGYREHRGKTTRIGKIADKISKFLNKRI